MPYVSEQIKIAGTKHDRRKKLTDDERVEIVDKHATGKYSQRQLARIYQVDRKTIYNILNPNKYQKQLERRRKEKVHLKYYDKEYHTKAIREHREYKQTLYTKGKIVLKEENEK